MKSFLRTCIVRLLGSLSNAVVRKYAPKIIMVTGSVGKTSTKDAIAAALSTSFYLRASEKSFNSELGVPLTIIGAENPWSSVRGWLRVFGEAFMLITFPNHYPRLLVLEVGADKPGDLSRMLRVVTPDLVVVTRLPEIPVHVEAYATPEEVREEEFMPAYALSDGDPLILSASDEYAAALATPLRVAVSTFGEPEFSDVRLLHARLACTDGMPVGMEADVIIGGEAHTLQVMGALGRTQLFGPAAALATGRALGIEVSELFAGLETYTPPYGRTRLFKGVKDSVLIDDTYNSSPAAVEEALGALRLLSESTPSVFRRVAVLGDMLELGRYSVAEHARIGVLVATHAELLVTVGQRSRGMARAALEAGMAPESLRHYDTAQEAAAALAELIQKGDAVLIKGSQGMRMEHAVKALLADPADASQLVRQDAEWSKR